jgi:Tfp pilus assembly protein PilE
MLPHKKKAFSLIELSIIILVIGILIAGVISSSKLIKASRLSSARTLTQSSPVASYKDLAVWFESTSSASFKESESEEDSILTSWYDINTHTTNPKNAIQTTSGKEPLYKIASKVNLPMVYFDGSNDHFLLPDDTIPSGDPSFTMFMVSSVLSSGTFDKTLISTEAVMGAQSLIIRYRISKQFTFVSQPVFEGTPFNQTVEEPTVITVAVSNGQSYTPESRIIKYYKNGSQGGSSTQGALSIPSVNNAIGARKHNTGTRDYFYGYIGEIIIYNRYLKTKERESIEAYLGKKWGIKVSS